MSEMPNLITYAAKLEIILEEKQSDIIWLESLTSYFDSLALGCQGLSVAIIGHIKGFLVLDDGGYCYLSTVGSEKGTTARNELYGQSCKGLLDFNVLVYGGKENRIKDMVKAETENLANLIDGRCTLRLPEDK